MSITQRQTARKIHKGYSLRIELLRSDAEDDGFVLNEAFRKGFFGSISGRHPSHKKRGWYLWIMGDLRAVWKGDDESHLGIQFLGNQWVEYVIFKRRPSTSRCWREWPVAIRLME